jgi:hypothetical protein
MFKAPQDSHRVLVAGFLAVLISHFEYISIETIIDVKMTSEMYIMLYLVAGLFFFVALWTVLSSSLNLKLYMRIGVISVWGILAHRLFYGVEQTGTMFVSTVMLISMSAWIPFAFTGMSFDDLQNIIEAWQDKKKDGKGTIIHNDFRKTNDNR